MTTTTDTAHAVTTRTLRPAGAILTAAGLAMLAVPATAAHAQSTIEWASPVDGDFGVAGNWFPAVVPGAMDTAVLGGVGPYVVGLIDRQGVSRIELNNPSAILRIAPSPVFDVDVVSGPGTITVGDRSLSSGSALQMGRFGEIASQVVLDGSTPVRAVITRAGGFGDLPRITTAGSVRGNGVLVDIQNNGTITASGSANVIELQGTCDQGATAELRSQNGGTIRIRGGASMATSALVRASSAGRVVVERGVSGGDWQIESGGVLEIDDDGSITGATITFMQGDLSSFFGQINDSTIVGRVTINPGDAIVFGSDVIVQDVIEIGDPSIGGGAALRISGDVSLAGRFELNGATVDQSFLARLASADRPTLSPSSQVRGTGTVQGFRQIGGTISPGLGSDGIGEIRIISGDAVPSVFGDNSDIFITVAGTADGEFDRITSDRLGWLTLAGSLDVDFVDGYVPEPRDQFEIISATTVDGSFTDIDIEPVGAIGPAHIVYTGESVILVICAADRDADGELTIFDFLAFQNLFDSGDLRADLDEDGQLTIFDFLVYQNRFDAGCG